MIENPWAYREAQNRIREQQEKEKKQQEKLFESFEKTRETIYVKKSFDIFDLKRRIETGRSLQILRRDIDRALKEGIISREAFDEIERAIDAGKNQGEKIEKVLPDDPEYAPPFSQKELAKFFEDKKMGENIWVDIGWFSYGFFVQWSAILVILAWKIFIDILFLPRDILDELLHRNT